MTPKTTRIDIIPRDLCSTGEIHARLTWWDWGPGYHAVLEGQFEDGAVFFEYLPAKKLHALKVAISLGYAVRINTLRIASMANTGNLIRQFSVGDRHFGFTTQTLTPVIDRIKGVRGEA